MSGGLQVDHLRQREPGVRVADAVLVPRVERFHADDDAEAIASTHGAIRKLIALSQRDVGEALLAGECGAVREAAEEDAH